MVRVVGERSGKVPELLQVSARMFTASGFHGTSMDGLATACGMTKASLYHYFASKSDILYAIYSSVIDAIDEKIRSHPADLKPVPRLRLTVSDLLKVQSTMSAQCTVFMQEGPLLSDCLPRHQAKELRAREAATTDYVIDTIAAGVRDGSIRKGTDATLAAFGILGMVSWVVRWYRPNGRASVEDIAALYTSMVLQGLEPS